MALGVVLLWLQGAFYVATAAWPILSRRTFEAVTGPKLDWWLVKTVAVLILAVGIGLLAAAIRQRVTFEIALLALGSALGLAYIDLRYAPVGRIRRVYLLDAAAELPLAALWLYVLLSGGTS
jgi:hypothetical protein